jgi:hypothetical protein
MAHPLADFQRDAIDVDTNAMVGLVDANSVYRNLGYARVQCGCCPSMCREKGDRMTGVAVSQICHTTGLVRV